MVFFLTIRIWDFCQLIILELFWGNTCIRFLGAGYDVDLLREDKGGGDGLPGVNDSMKMVMGKVWCGWDLIVVFVIQIFM